MKINEEDETVEFFVCMYGDVVWEILGLGNRRQIVKLERVGRRIQRMVESYLGERPFLSFCLEINERFSFCIK